VPNQSLKLTAGKPANNVAVGIVLTIAWSILGITLVKVLDVKASFAKRINEISAKNSNIL
jgi:hypothetical protein